MISRGQQQLSPEASEKMIYAIQKETHRMNRLISDMLDASQIGAGRFTIQREPMDLVSLARDIVQQQQATTTKHHIILEAPKSLEGVWDADRIAQVLTNLLSNAIKYSPEGGYIWVNLSQVDGNATVRVTDQGIGVAPDDIPLLFEPFSRLYREQPAKGTGLGLYITKAIVEAHGGRIQVESAGPGKGSSFILTLPLSGPPPSSRFTPPRKRSP
jgi:signal transduction histidine kinase